ncbi:MAG: peptide-N-glycosidase, partial [Marinilabiliales bacterium]|nr:peptide-N-glycosidase [Marinilabiliales bacterium]
RLVIRNLGKKVLKRLNIVYGTEGFASRTYLWRGLLPFNETTTVTLPGKIDFMEGKNLFRVKLVGPNEHLDEWTDDNQSVTIFYAPPRLPADMVLAYRTNLRPAENKLIIRNQDSLVVYRRDSIGTVSNKRYMDTLHLQPGVYELMLSDAKGDGMEFWAEKEQGFGFLRMMDLDGHLLKNFESDCGKGIFYSFSVDPRYIWLEEKNPPVFILYPKRTKDNLTISYCLNRSATLELLIVSESGQKENYKFDKVKDGEAVLPVKHLGKGKYTLEAFENGFRRFSSRFTVEE